MGLRPAAGSIKRMLMIDTETTGLGAMSRVRSISSTGIMVSDTGGITIGDTRSRIFYRQPGMEGGLIKIPTTGEVVSLGQGLPGQEIPAGAIADVIDVVTNPEQARQRLTQELTDYLSYDAIAFKNARFDVEQLMTTARAMPGFETDQNLKQAVTAFSERISADPHFIVDVDFSGRVYMQRRLSERIENYVGQAILDPASEQARFLQSGGIGLFDNTGAALFADYATMPEELKSQIGNLLVSKSGFFASREMFEQMAIGGRFTPQSMDNMAIVSNIFELIHQEAIDGGPDQNAARRVMEMITQGSHISETDAYLSGFFSKYIQTRTT